MLYTLRFPNVLLFYSPAAKAFLEYPTTDSRGNPISTLVCGVGVKPDGSAAMERAVSYAGNFGACEDWPPMDPNYQESEIKYTVSINFSNTQLSQANTAG